MQAQSGNKERGTAWVRWLVAVALAALAAAFALPAYEAYVRRGRLAVALVALDGFAERLQQQQRRSGTFAGPNGCALEPPLLHGFVFSCSAAPAGSAFTAEARGSGAMQDYRYAIDSQGRRTTLAHPGGVPPAPCWTLAGGACDYRSDRP